MSHSPYRTAVLLLVAAWTTAGSVHAQTEDSVLAPRCGDCWCSYARSEGLDGCPDAPEGIRDSFPVSQFGVYSTFELLNPDAPFLKLQAADGSPNCYPFAGIVQPDDGYPRSSYPPCVKQELADSDTAVCAYKFPNARFGDDVPVSDLEQCQGREYEIRTYENATAAEADNALVTHAGACGVCSSASDLWSRMDSLLSMESQGLTISVSYSLADRSTDERFVKLVQEYKDRFGFSDDCALIWSHFSATNAVECSAPCFPTQGFVPKNSDPPQCDPLECITCSQDFTAAADRFAGHGTTLERSGIPLDIVKPCDEFTPVVHDPCAGAQSMDTEPTMAPTSLASGQSISAVSALAASTAVLIAVISIRT